MKKLFLRMQLAVVCGSAMIFFGCRSLPVIMPGNYQPDVNYKNLSLACEIGEIQWADAPNQTIRQNARKYMEAKLIYDHRRPQRDHRGMKPIRHE